MKRLLATVAAGALATAGLALAATPASAAGTAMVSVVHGIPNTPVNVFVNGTDQLPNFQPGTVAGPLELPAGSYDVKIFPASDTQGTGTPVLQATAQVQSGNNYTLVAHLDASGKPALTPYQNDVSPIAAGKARVIVRHDAAAPAVDVRANGTVAFSNLTNPNEAKADLPAGTVSADVVLAGTSTVVIGPANVNLAEGTVTIAYAIGSADQKTLSLVTQTISGMQSAPGGVPAGTGGLLDRGTPEWVWPVTAAMIAVALLGGVGLTRTLRSRER